ncbi:MAG: MBL fold metallo-hydrolase [Spirochaetes bacterium]|nr:MBL fold metallo-hydrolase [Spirochaetota bacterium]
MIKENKLKHQPYFHPDFKPDFSKWDNNKISFCLLGHSTVLINFYGVYIITDPVLFKRIGPPEFMNNLFGIRRITACPVEVRKLPPISYIVISHAHYDHLDLPSIKALIKKQKKNPPLIIIPSETSYIFKSMSDLRLMELPWNKKLSNSEITIIPFKVEHYGTVANTVRNKKSGFNGYSFIKNGKTIMFFGDTSFKKLRNRDGIRLKSPESVDWKKQTGNRNPDLAIIPIGDYYYDNHTSPAQAVKIGQMINAAGILPVHYNTFILSPPEKYKSSPDSIMKSLLSKKIKFRNYETSDLKFPEIGLSCYLD